MPKSSITARQAEEYVAEQSDLELVLCSRNWPACSKRVTV
ncbi:hypothetical protein GTPT_2232 [Tatumella ptyseos ATCC 33301]|uniref:Uncharacterized protein n=1 Tax=Tatumella ptyseos ATCC 33301 TaxID=1005995 RepID=A0A085JEN5_9GAMM|nr:hypothetical protein GTPT_2232 [Tatumella ptyseos ATCC 33301]